MSPLNNHKFYIYKHTDIYIVCICVHLYVNILYMVNYPP